MEVSFWRKRQSNIAKYFSMDGDLLYRNDGCVLMEELQVEHAPEQWRLLIASSKVRLKKILLQNGNKHLSISLAHTFHVSGT